ncbi:MAG: FHA domain-containing protein [Sutterellaceae bacterium]|nr:FHA domain-containing protein [Burkholderiaceae bacterium]MDW8429568.1 FHA domain-containing protein [Sutterellaceae bacterium]
MELVLRVLSSGDGSDVTPLVARFDASGGLIGRADSARLRLPDPKRTVSRFHAHVSFADGKFFIEDMGSPNPVTVNGHVLRAGERVELNPGDRLGIAHYVVGVEIGDSQPALAEEDVPWEERPEADERTRIVSDRATWAATDGPPATAQQLWEAFQEGANVQIELPHGLHADTMRTIGAVLRGAVAALRRQLGLSMLVRRDSEAASPPVRSRNNNPLKFALDDARALAALVKPPLPTFLSGPQAIEESAAELEAHARATMFAMRAAMRELFARIDPALLEKKAGSRGFLHALFPARRKAALWEQYLAALQELTAGAGGLDEAYARAFLTAYEQEIARARRPATVVQAAERAVSRA